MAETTPILGRAQMRSVAWNIGVLLLAILPIFLLFIWLYSMAAGVDSRADLVARFPAEFLGGYLVFFVPFVLIAGVQWTIVTLLPTTWRRSRRRAVAVLLAPGVSLLAAALFPSGLLRVAHFMVPLVLALTLFGAIMRLRNQN